MEEKIFCLNKKVFCWFSTISAMGLGILVVMLLVVVMRTSHYLKRAMIVFGGGGDGDSCKRTTLSILTNTQTKHQNSSHSVISKRPITDSTEENCSPGDSEPPKKRGRKSMYAEHRCGDCTVWLQTGGDENLLKYHKSESRMRHPGDQCVKFSNFLSCQGAYAITLRTDSCLCNACHRDCLRSCGKPRWLGLSKHIVCKHCFVCCKGPTSCVCDSISEWGPVQHFNNEEIKKLAEHLQ